MDILRAGCGRALSLRFFPRFGVPSIERSVTSRSTKFGLGVRGFFFALGGLGFGLLFEGYPNRTEVPFNYENPLSSSFHVGRIY